MPYAVVVDTMLQSSKLSDIKLQYDSIELHVTLTINAVAWLCYCIDKVCRHITGLPNLAQGSNQRVEGIRG